MKNGFCTEMKAVQMQLHWNVLRTELKHTEIGMADSIAQEKNSQCLLKFALKVAFEYLKACQWMPRAMFALVIAINRLRNDVWFCFLANHFKDDSTLNTGYDAILHAVNLEFGS